MPPTRAQLDRIARLRELFLDEERAGSALRDYWRDELDLQAYDAVLAARIGWKWDAVLAECVARGLAATPAATVLDFGCGTGVAAARYIARFGGAVVHCHDRSARAMAFAAARVRALAPSVAAAPAPDVASLRPDVLLVSHVLGELDDRGEQALRQLIERSGCVLVVEPGSRLVARRLMALRDDLRSTFSILAPCSHAGACPGLVLANEWCHFFAPPPPEVFTDGEWVRTARAVGVDLRSLPYAFVAAVRRPVAAVGGGRVLGRPDVSAHAARLRVCTAGGLQDVEVTKRADPVRFRQLKNHPERTMHWPQS